ncbi:hypothetical protein L6452_38461 [Arctium lappa]|uniref:Uncharacterized protein n=1 Tax=Arctium lappa TaxID=4217 RepID=A0ACB8XP22_ARCLA|nr:hypothetical protein L6452_38461 [Arctium lappa]
MRGQGKKAGGFCPLSRTWSFLRTASGIFGSKSFLFVCSNTHTKHLQLCVRASSVIHSEDLNLLTLIYQGKLPWVMWNCRNLFFVHKG